MESRTMGCAHDFADLPSAGDAAPSMSRDQAAAKIALVDATITLLQCERQRLAEIVEGGQHGR